MSAGMPVVAMPSTSKFKRSYARESDRWTALRTRDQAADGHFFYSVRSTGVYCYPSCSARPPLPENVAFHDTQQQAEAAGFRPCKRCRSDLPPRVEREAQLVAQACRIIEGAEDIPSLTDLARAVGCSPHHFHRLFKRVTGVTPKGYGDAHRHTRVRAALANGGGVTEAFYDSGYNSSGRFYNSANDMLGMTPRAYRAGGLGETIQYSVEQCCLGYVLVALSGRGVCAILMGDDPESLAQDLGSRFPKAELQAAETSLRDVVGRVVRLIDNPLVEEEIPLPLDIRGTAFQRQVWDALRQIPVGKTVSYSELAAKIGSPKGMRAVAAACAANNLAVAVPCHRVIAASGNISGYRWGVERKKRLLETEQN